MRCTHALAFLLVFLTGCTSASKAREPDPQPPLKADVPAAGVRTEAVLAASPEVAKTFRSALPICYDAALKVCRDRDWRIVNQQPSASISAHAPSFDVMLSFSRTPENRTKVTVRRNPDSRDDSKRLLDQLCDALLEPKE
jgi:hypothetical protein